MTRTTHLCMEGDYTIHKDADDVGYFIQVTPKFENAKVIAYGNPAHHGLQNMALGLTSRTSIPTNADGKKSLWLDKEQTVMLHMHDLTISQGEFHVKDGLVRDDLKIIIGDKLEFWLDSSFHLKLIVNDKEWGYFSVGPGRSNFCGELRWQDQNFKFEAN